MSVILILIVASLFMAFVFLAGFFWAVRSGQYEDTNTPSMRILFDDRTPAPGTEPAKHETPKEKISAD